MLPLRPLGDRVIIQADVEDRAPTATAAGVFVAKTLAAAVEGDDAEDSWFVGTVVAVGPLVQSFQARPYLRRRLREWIDAGHPIATKELAQALAQLDACPEDTPEPIRVGDRVTFSWASGQQITIDETRYLIMRAADVLAVLNPEDAIT